MDPSPSLQPSRDRTAFAALVSAAYGSAAVALMFLVIDALRGDPFLTPSLMGSTVLLGLEPSRDLPVRLDMVALYSVVHYLAFAALGTAATLLANRLEGLRRSAFALPALLLGVLMAGELIADWALFPGLSRAVGLGWVTAANVVAAGVMGRFIRITLIEEDFSTVRDLVFGVPHPNR
jgi:hypothetical protein